MGLERRVRRLEEQRHHQRVDDKYEEAERLLAGFEKLVMHEAAYPETVLSAQAPINVAARVVVHELEGDPVAAGEARRELHSRDLNPDGAAMLEKLITFYTEGED